MSGTPPPDFDSLLRADSIAVLGCEALLRDHALALHDGQLDVRIGLIEPPGEADDVSQSGPRVTDRRGAVADSSVIVVAPSDAGLSDVGTDLGAGDLVVVAQPSSRDQGSVIVPRPDVDVVVVQWPGPGQATPAPAPVLVGVVQDHTGDAWRLAADYARTIASFAPPIPSSPGSVDSSEPGHEPFAISCGSTPIA